MGVVRFQTVIRKGDDNESGEGWGRKGKARTWRGKEWTGKGVCIHGCPAVPYGVDVAARAGGVVIRGQVHGAEDLVGGG